MPPVCQDYVIAANLEITALDKIGVHIYFESGVRKESADHIRRLP
jgi:hypothetical protein